MRSSVCAFSYVPGFVAKTQNPSILDICCNRFTIPSLEDFVDRDRMEMLLCPVKAIKWYQSTADQYHPVCGNHFISTGRRKKRE